MGAGETQGFVRAGSGIGDTDVHFDNQAMGLGEQGLAQAQWKGSEGNRVHATTSQRYEYGSPSPPGTDGARSAVAFCTPPPPPPTLTGSNCGPSPTSDAPSGLESRA